VLFTFPSRYSFPIGGQAYLALEGGPPSFPQDFACPVVLRYCGTARVAVAYGTLTRCGGPSQTLQLTRRPEPCALLQAPQPYNPGADACDSTRSGLGNSPVRSPLLRASRLIPLPRGTEMFQFPRCPSRRLCIQRAITGVATSWVAPFGFDWLIARLQLPSHVSPLSAPFVGTWPLGIHPTPFSAWLAFSRSRFVSSRYARFDQHDPASSFCDPRFDLVRFGKIEVNPHS
jgi:hypothetical protein